MVDLLELIPSDGWLLLAGTCMVFLVLALFLVAIVLTDSE